MIAPEYLATVSHGAPIRGRVLLNGIPAHFVARSMGGGTRTDPVNHFLVPGTNHFAVEVDELPDGDWLAAHVRVGHEEGLAYYLVPDPVDRKANPPPYRYETRFEARVAAPAPYGHAPATEYDERGTPGQRAAIERLHATLRRGGSDALHDELRLKFEGLRAVYGALPRLDDGALRARYRDAMDAGCETAPLPPDLVYQSCAGGRVACVVRRGGEWALTAVMGGLPFRTNVYLLHQGDDAWSVIW